MSKNGEEWERDGRCNVSCDPFWTPNRIASGIAGVVLLGGAWVWLGFPAVLFDVVVVVFALGCIWIPDAMQQYSWKVGRVVAPEAFMAMGWLMLFFPMALHLLHMCLAGRQ